MKRALHFGSNFFFTGQTEERLVILWKADAVGRTFTGDPGAL
jgi:hypothetical protein